MYNNSIYKSGWMLVNEEDKCVIDSNLRLEERIEEIEAERRRRRMLASGEDDGEGFTGGLIARKLEAPDGEASDISGNVIKAQADEEPAGPTLEEVRAQIEEERRAAEAEVEQIRNIARSEIDAEKREAINEGRKNGYAEGLEMARNEADKLKAELEAERVRLEAEYQSLIDELEPKFIDTITEIYEQVFGIDLADEKDILVYLIDSTLRRIENSRTFIVHVSKDDYAYVNERRQDLSENAVSGRGMVEVVEDITLRRNECMIETDGGIFDCGVGTQLSELTKKLRLLSYEKG